MKILVINLNRAKERLERMAAQFAAQKLEFERQAATDGQALSERDRSMVDDNHRKWFTPYPLSDNEVGCWLSHREAIIKILRSGEPMGVVLEDDAELSPEFAQLLHEVETKRPRFDFIFLHRKFKANEKFYPVLPLLPDINLGIVGYSHMGAIGYIVSREGARKFIEETPNFVHAFDKQIHRYWANGLMVYGLSRPVVTTNDHGYSYIEETRAQELGAAERKRYPDSEHIFWKSVRKCTRLLDSAGKHFMFPSYVYSAKKENKL